MKTRVFVAIVCICLIFQTSSAQVIGIQEVVQEVLKNNFDSRLAQKDVNLAGNNATKGNAGLLPSVQLNTGANYSNNNTQIIFAGNIPPIEVDGAVNTSYNASLGANYTLFSGFANLRRFDQLKVAEDLSEEQLRLTLENAIVTTVGLYLDLARLSEDRANLETNLRLSSSRLRQLNRAREIGTATLLDVMSAEVDYNQDSSSLLTLENQMGNIKRQINLLMGRSVATTFEADTTQKSLPDFTLVSVLENARNSNASLVLAKLKMKSTELGADIASAGMMPNVSLTTSYGYVSSQNAAGIVLEQNNLGFSSGISISLPIYNGGKIRTAVDNAKIEIAKSEISKEQMVQMVEKEVYDHWFNFEHYKNLQELETQNYRTAELRMDQARKRYELRQITSLDYREAQLALLSAKSRLNAATYNARKSAYQLTRLNGTLLTE